METCTHTERPAAARCIVCGEVLCHDCKVFKKGRNYCRFHAPGKPAGYRSPTFSMILSLIPGLGQMYAGSFVKGLAFLMGGGACIAMQDSLPRILPLALLLFSTWDARMTALRRNHDLSGGRLGEPAGDGDWMLILGTVGLAILYTVLPLQAGVTLQPGALWAAFCVVLILSTLLGRGGKKDVQES
ncbi:MAG: hypothetical protein KJ645_08260 [Planctomycetes bacterium]|nr:hypothetical protein [Planctomycetota bacterium]